MAGFFRQYGNFFYKYTGKRISFDDKASADLKTYEEAWKAPPNSGRDWNIGYVRSVQNESLNDYRENLEDLYALFKTAPEVRRCLVKRLFEYVVSDQQTIDGGYLDYLTDEFNNRAKKNSSDALVWTVSKLLLSQSFRQPDPDPDQCYDYKPGYDPTDAPPCRVGYILRTNCHGCHGSTSGYKHLDLTSWITLPDGTKNFPHLDDNGNQLPASETLQRLAFRLSTSDPKMRMPPFGMYLSSQDRQEIYLWTQQMLTGGTK
jgi:hypothetical protein